MKTHGFQYGLFLTALALVFLSGCSRYQYIAITSDIHQNKEQNFVVENDTARIVYSFDGYNFPVTVQVYNKLDKPLYIDWTKSALIIDGKTMSFWQDVAQLEGSTEGYTTGGKHGIAYSVGIVNGTISKNEKISFVPPGSFVKTTRFHLQNRFFATNNSASEKKENFNSANGQDWGKIYTFNRDHTPLEFRSYITLSTDKNFSSETHVSNSFWVDNIMQTLATPVSMQNSTFPKTYLRKVTSTGFVLGLIFGIGILAALGFVLK